MSRQGGHFGFPGLAWYCVAAAAAEVRSWLVMRQVLSVEVSVCVWTPKVLPSGKLTFADGGAGRWSLHITTVACWSCR